MMEELKPCLFPCNLEQLNDRINTLGLEIARMGNNDTIRVHKDFLVATLDYMEELFGLRREKLNRRAEPENKPLEQLKAENANLQEALKLMAQDFYDSSDDEIHTGADSLADDYIQMAQVGSKPENKALTCDGCVHHNPDAPWPEICFDCKRQSRQDMYRRNPKGSNNL